MATMQPRRDFLNQALKYFLRQTYSPKELILVDDPGEPACDLIPPVPEVRYLQTKTQLTLGGKLNFGIQEARGAIIQKLDDDDYYHPEFLSATVGALLAGNQPDYIVALTSHLVLIAATGELKLRNRKLFAGATFCFFKELWRKHPFRDVNLAEDRFFLEEHGRALIEIDNPELYCYVRHAKGNTWRNFRDSQQTPHGPVTDPGDVTEYHRKELPLYTKNLNEYIPEEDLWFYENQVEHHSDTRAITENGE
jgi:glycosyltransferase involved in cell wall biosynthesis